MGMGNSYCKIGRWIHSVSVQCEAYKTELNMYGGLILDVSTILCSNKDRFLFQVAWYDLLVIDKSIGLGFYFLIFVGFWYFNGYLCTTHHPEVGDSFCWRWRDMETQSTHELLWTKGNVLLIHLSFIFKSFRLVYFVCTSLNGLNFALLASIVYWHKVHLF